LAFPVRLDRRSKALKLIQQVRDEAHRFAVGYSRLLHKKELLG
ncbi:excinuclease ABC subunit C, partial [Candidatus Methanophagaceae archaeon]